MAEEMTDGRKVPLLEKHSWHLRHGMAVLLESGEWDEEELRSRIEGAEKDYAERREAKQKLARRRRATRHF